MANKQGFLSAGELDTPIDVYTNSNTQNDYGELITSRVLLKTVWAKLVKSKGGEKVKDDTIVGTTDQSFLVRYDEDLELDSTTISPSDYLVVKYLNKFWNVRGVEYLGRGKGVVISCELTDNNL